MMPPTPAPLWDANAADARPPEPSSTTCWPPEAFRRHAFVRLHADARVTVEHGDPAPLRDWLARGRPLIVRRPGVSADGSTVALGLARPGRQRLACRAATADVAEFLPSPVWTDPAFAPFTPRLFGSHAWQLLVGIPYVTPASDVDLCVDITSVAEWDAFRATAGAAPGALDGSPRRDMEIVFRGDAAFVWREYLGGAREILVKSNAGVRLHPRDALVELLP